MCLVEMDDIARLVAGPFELVDNENVASSKEICERQEVLSGDR